MDMLLQLLPVLDTIKWPLLIFIIYCMSKGSLLPRIKSAKIGNKSMFEFSETTSGLSLTPRNGSGDNFVFESNKPANTYWLGHDLMWTIDAIYRGATIKKIVHGLNQILHHLIQIGGENTGYAKDIRDIKKIIEGQTDSEFSEKIRRELGCELDKLLYRIGGSIQTHQPDFNASNPGQKILT